MKCVCERPGEMEEIGTGPGGIFNRWCPGCGRLHCRSMNPAFPVDRWNEPAVLHSIAWRPYPKTAPEINPVEKFITFFFSHTVLFRTKSAEYAGRLKTYEDASRWPPQWEMAGPDGYVVGPVTHWMPIPPLQTDLRQYPLTKTQEIKLFLESQLDITGFQTRAAADELAEVSGKKIDELTVGNLKAQHRAAKINLKLRKALGEYAQWVQDLQSNMYINCVYCGHRYGPNNKVPAAMADVLKEHIEHCPKHPMSLLRQEHDELLGALKTIISCWGVGGVGMDGFVEEARKIIDGEEPS